MRSNIYCSFYEAFNALQRAALTFEKMHGCMIVYIVGIDLIKAFYTICNVSKNV